MWTFAIIWCLSLVVGGPCSKLLLTAPSFYSLADDYSINRLCSLSWISMFLLLSLSWYLFQLAPECIVHPVAGRWALTRFIEYNKYIPILRTRLYIYVFNSSEPKAQWPFFFSRITGLNLDPILLGGPLPKLCLR